MIGPHEKRELEMMLAGTKPAAVITDYEEAKAFQPHVSNGRFGCLFGKFAGDRGFFAVFYQKGNEAQGKRLLEIFESPERPHREIGRLLGYSPEDIEHFMRRHDAILADMRAITIS